MDTPSTQCSRDLMDRACGNLRLGGAAMTIALLFTSALPSSVRAQHRNGTETRWLGADPHVPMALVSSDRIEPVSWTGSTSPAASAVIERTRRAICGAWSRVGVSWHAVDRWGQDLGPRILRSRDFYDVTRCYEVFFPDDPPAAPNPWQPGRIVLYARGAWSANSSVEWQPSAEQQRGHAHFIDALTAMTLPPEARESSRASASGDPALPSIRDRTMYFHFTDPGEHDTTMAPRERRMAVTGGRVLILAERNADGSWFAVHIDNSFGTQYVSNNLGYIPVAVFDMNGDGWPEVVIHEREGGGEFYGDMVISRDENGTWRVVARSVGGSTA